MTEVKRFRCIVDCPEHCEYDWNGEGNKPFKCDKHPQIPFVIFTNDGYVPPEHILKAYNNAFRKVVESDGMIKNAKEPTDAVCAIGISGARIESLEMMYNLVMDDAIYRSE